MTIGAAMKMTQEQLKEKAAKAALEYIDSDAVVGVGTGSTVNFFIDALATIKGKIECAVASSKTSEERLKAHGIPVYNLNSVNQVDVYVDGTDEITKNMHCIKGGGAALTGEKIIVQMAKRFICIADESKLVDVLGQFPLPIEVIPMARSYVARLMVKLGGDPVYREGVITDYGNVILDVYNLDISEPVKLEEQLNHIPGIVTNGLFAKRPADILLLGTSSEVRKLS